MSQKDAMINGMGNVILEQNRHISDLKEQQGVLDRIGPKLTGASTLDLQRELEKEKELRRSAVAALRDKEAILKEWMHSNEAFKRLARKYGKKLGVSDEQRYNDIDEEVIAVAEEKPEFSNTNLLKEAKEARGMK